MNTLKCENCGKKLKKGQKFCPGCGKKLDMQKTCTKCGSLLEGDYKFCPECGTSVDEKHSSGYVHSERYKHIGIEKKAGPASKITQEQFTELIKVASQLLQKFGREPQSEEIAREMGTTVKRMRGIVEIAQDQISSGIPIGEEDSSLSDFIDEIGID